MDNIKASEQKPDTEALIFQAAKKVFGMKGLDGARMQEIIQVVQSLVQVM